MNTIDSSLPIVHTARCQIAQSTIMIADPIRYTTRHGDGTTPGAYETDLIVVLTGAMGTHYMVWRESPDIRDPGRTAIHHVVPGDECGIAREILDEVGAPALLDPIALVRLLDESAGPILGVHTMGRRSDDLACTIITACRSAIRDTGTAATAETRADGLSLETACKTIEYVAGQRGARTERRGWTVASRDAVPSAAADQIAAIMALHGFAMATTPDGDGLVAFTVDATTCPSGDNLADERKQLADDLAERVEREVGVNQDDWRAVERAADNEFRWCLEQTLPFLRDRAGRRPETATSGTTSECGHSRPPSAASGNH